jgi:aubergine-like protein
MICLVPELCVITGLTDDMRKDFRVMKELSNHTRLAPPERHEAFRIFIDTIRNTPNALKQLTNWGLELDDDIVEVCIGQKK